MSDKEIDFIVKGIRFRRSPAKMGKRYVFNIPNLYIENGLIDPNETYDIYLAKTEDDDDKED